MPKTNYTYRDFDINNHCNNLANQYLILVTIFAAIISQEIENDEDLGILGSFLISLGEEISLASETRISCKAKFEDEGYLSGQIEDVFDRGFKDNDNKNLRKVRRKYIKKVKKNPKK